MPNPFTHENMSAWTFSDYRNWIINLRLEFSGDVPLDKLLTLDSYAQEFWNSDHINTQNLESDAFSLALISLRSPPPKFFADNDKGKLQDVSQVLSKNSDYSRLKQEEIAKRNLAELRKILQNTESSSYRMLIRDFIQRDKEFLYKVEFSSKDPNASFNEFARHPERYQLSVIPLPNKTPKIRTGGLAELDKEYHISRRNFDVWASGVTECKKSTLIPLAFCLGLNYGLADQFFQLEGFSYLDSTRPKDKLFERCIKSGFDFYMTRRLFLAEGFSF